MTSGLTDELRLEQISQDSLVTRSTSAHSMGIFTLSSVSRRYHLKGGPNADLMFLTTSFMQLGPLHGNVHTFTCSHWQAF
jgi:hypothetical protein